HGCGCGGFCADLGEGLVELGVVEGLVEHLFGGVLVRDPLHERGARLVRLEIDFAVAAAHGSAPGASFTGSAWWSRACAGPGRVSCAWARRARGEDVPARAGCPPRASRWRAAWGWAPPWERPVRRTHAPRRALRRSRRACSRGACSRPWRRRAGGG